MITALLYTLLVLHVVGLVATPWAVGRERKPLTVSAATAQSTINLIVLVMIVIVLVQR